MTDAATTATPPSADPSPADPPADPPAAGDDKPPTADEVVKNPQALIDALGSVRDENRRQARRLRDFERTERERADAAKTELQRATDRATDAETKLASRELDHLRLEVALEQLLGDDPRVKLAMTLATRLQGKTREEIQTDAAAMRQLLGQQASTPPPVPAAGGSRLSDGNTTPGSDAAFNAELRRRAGRG
jgi:hypothetical protein